MTDPQLPTSLVTERHGEVLVVRLSRAAKRNALDDQTVLGLERLFTDPPAWARAAAAGTYRSSRAASRTLSRVRVATLEGSEKVRLTVAIETPARSATW